MSEREYPVPGYPDYFVLANGQVVSYKLGKRSIIKGARQVYGFQGKRIEYRHRLISTEGERYARQAQVVVSAKYGRWPEPHKEARHMDTFIHYGIVAGEEAFNDSGTARRRSLQRAPGQAEHGLG